MNLLLTSNGLVNAQIEKAFINLALKSPSELTVAFIPTARNRDTQNTRKHARIFNSLDKIGVRKVDIVDIEGLSKALWLPRLESADVIYIGGGNTYYLLHCVRQSGLDQELAGLLRSRTYIGDSAGAILVTPSIDIACVENGDENFIDIKDTTGLNIVDFEVSPHTPEDVSILGNQTYANSIQNILYAYDNQTAIQVQNGRVSFVGTGNHHIFND